MINNPIIKNIKLSVPISLVAICLYSIVFTSLLFFMLPNTGVSIWPLVVESKGLIFLLNQIPCLVLAMFLFFATGKLTLAIFISGIPLMALSVVNRYMVAFRFAPLKPLDLRLGMEFFGVAKSIRPIVYITLCIGMVLTGFVFFLSQKYIKNAKPNIALRLIGGVIAIATMVCANQWVYKNHNLHNTLPYTGFFYNETNLYGSRGFIYSFLYDLNTNKINRPGFYSHYADEIAEIESSAYNLTGFAADANQYINIVMVLNEAFSELAINPLIDFYGFDDPLVNYRRIKEESPIAGYLIVPHLGGGTSDTEFDILTGLNSRAFLGVPYSFALITRPISSIPWVFKEAGYTTLAMHPGAGWFYNRQNIYPLLGFDIFIDDSGFDTNITKGMYITDMHAVGRFVEEYENQMQNSPHAPLFAKLITIQNHGPYNGKYGQLEPNFYSGQGFNASETDALTQYFHGLANGDESLGYLWQYFASKGEPVILIFFGDHLPSMHPDIYSRLLAVYGDPSQSVHLLNYYRVPFVIWANSAAQGLIDFTQVVLPGDKTISAHYLGALLLELMGMDGIDPLYRHLNEQRIKYPVEMGQILVDEEGALRAFDPEIDGVVAFMRSWEYYRVNYR